MTEQQYETTIDDVLARYGIEITTSDELDKRRNQAFADMEIAYQQLKITHPELFDPETGRAR